MKVSSNSNASVAIRLQDWLDQPEVKEGVRLKGPSRFAAMSGPKRRSEERKDRTRVAERIMELNFGSDAELTAIVYGVHAIRISESNKDCRNAIRDALRKVQEVARAAYLDDTCAYSRSTVATAA